MLTEDSDIELHASKAEKGLKLALSENSLSPLFFLYYSGSNKTYPFLFRHHKMDSTAGRFSPIDLFSFHQLDEILISGLSCLNRSQEIRFQCTVTNGHGSALDIKMGKSVVQY